MKIALRFVPKPFYHCVDRLAGEEYENLCAYCHHYGCDRRPNAFTLVDMPVPSRYVLGGENVEKLKSVFRGYFSNQSCWRKGKWVSSIDLENFLHKETLPGLEFPHLLAHLLLDFQQYIFIGEPLPITDRLYHDQKCNDVVRIIFVGKAGKERLQFVLGILYDALTKSLVDPEQPFPTTHEVWCRIHSRIKQARSNRIHDVT